MAVAVIGWWVLLAARDLIQERPYSPALENLKLIGIVLLVGAVVFGTAMAVGWIMRVF